MKLFICGHGRHGKDKFAEYLREASGLTFVSSSWFVAERVVFPWFKKHRGYHYEDVEACYEDRHNERESWYEAIKQYNQKDPTLLSRELFMVYDMYVGIRDDLEFLASKKHACLSIWIDASKRVEYFDPTCKITRDMCDIVIENNGTEKDLERKAWRLADAFGRTDYRIPNFGVAPVA